MIDDQLLLDKTTENFAFPDIEYLGLENLIVNISEQLGADWTYDPQDDVYVLELREDEESQPEFVTVYSEVCASGFNEGRELLVCEADIGPYNVEEEGNNDTLLELFKLVEPLIFSRLYITQDNQVILSAKTLIHDIPLEMATAMVEDVSSYAESFRDELETPDLPE